MLYIIISSLIVILFFYYIPQRNKNYWHGRGVNSVVSYTFFDICKALMANKPQAEKIQELYSLYPQARYVGCSQFFSKIFLLRDAELIKTITVKNFDHFINRPSFVPDEPETLFGKNLFALKNQKWRDMRATLGPAFTSTKLKYMFALITEKSEKFLQHFLKLEDEVIVREMGEIFQKYTNDMIANIAFGIEIDSLQDPQNQFFHSGKTIQNFNIFLKILNALGFFISPKLFKVLKIPPFKKKSCEFLSSVLLKNIDFRRKEHFVRPDMINILLSAQENDKMVITDEDIVAQAVAFFFAGFETESGAMSFLAYELAVNPEIQARLTKEIDGCEGKLTYEALTEMRYLEMVVLEGLRKWPNALLLNRMCNKNYTIPAEKPGEEDVEIEEGTTIWIPIFSVHRNPEYFPNPEQFDPERFNKDNKEKINPYAFLPFGLGPRSCIGGRLAILEIKVLFFHILSKFQFVTVKRTPVPLKLDKASLGLSAEGGFWLGLKRRQD